MNKTESKLTSATVSITEVTYISGKTAKLNLIVDDRKVGITLPVELKAYFDEQFSRPNPTAIQKRKYATIMNLMKAAYKQGLADAK